MDKIIKTRAAPLIGAILGMTLVRAGPSHALSLRSSAAEAFLGDVLPGTTAVLSRATGAKLRVENSGRDPARIEFKIVPPSPGGLKDGYEPWPYPDRVRMTTSRAELKPGEAAQAELSVTAPKVAALLGGQYEFDVMATGFDPAGASLTLKTKVLLAIGPPLSSAGVPAGGYAERPGFTLAPPSAVGNEATLKLVNAGEEELTATLSPARSWDDSVRIADGYEAAPNPRWLRFEPGAVKVRAGSITRARVWADVPREPRYAGRRWAFVTAVDAVAGGRRTRRYFVLNVMTTETEEKTQVR